MIYSLLFAAKYESTSTHPLSAINQFAVRQQIADDVGVGVAQIAHVYPLQYDLLIRQSTGRRSVAAREHFDGGIGTGLAEFQEHIAKVTCVVRSAGQQIT